MNTKSAETIKSQSSSIQWRKPSKFSGTLAVRLMSEFKKISSIQKVHLCELSCTQDEGRFSPLIALEGLEKMDPAEQQKIISQICDVIMNTPDLEEPVNVCASGHMPELGHALRQGMTRTLFVRNE